jgi:hypothetical protein
MILKPVAVLAVLALSVLAAGCGGSSSKSSSPASSTTATTATTPALGQPGGGGAGRAFPAAFTTCLKQHGVSLPTGGFRRPPGAPGSPPAGTTPRNRPAATPARAKQRAAFAACRKFAPQGFGAGFGRGRGRGQFASYSACMKKQGITLGPGAQVDLTSAKFKAAAKQCRSQLPAAANGPGAAGPRAGSGGSGQ